MRRKFALSAVAPDHGAPDGVIVMGAEIQTMLGKLARRADHYGALHFARGEGWVALFAEDGTAPLPWAGGSPLYLRRLARGLFCEIGYQPNVPAALALQLGAHLARSYDVAGPVALTAAPRLVDLSAARRLSELNLAAMRA